MSALAKKPDQSDGHVTVNTNLITLIKPHLRGSGCKSYISDMKVRIGEDSAYYYPDLLVSCDPADHKRNYIKQSPLLIVEILSSSTEAYDRGDKFAFYRQLESLQEYVHAVGARIRKWNLPASTSSAGCGIFMKMWILSWGEYPPAHVLAWH